MFCYIFLVLDYKVILSAGSAFLQSEQLCHFIQFWFIFLSQKNNTNKFDVKNIDRFVILKQEKQNSSDWLQNNTAVSVLWI